MGRPVAAMKPEACWNAAAAQCRPAVPAPGFTLKDKAVGADRPSQGTRRTGHASAAIAFRHGFGTPNAKPADPCQGQRARSAASMSSGKKEGYG